MRVFSSFVLCVTAASALVAGVASHPELVNLEQRIAAAPSGERAALLVRFAERAEAVDPARARAAAEEAEKIATSSHDRLAARAIRASLLRQQTDYKTALVVAREGLAEATSLGDDALRARFLYVIARTSWSLADYPAALAHFHQTIHLGERLGDKALLADAHTGTVTIYTELKDHAQARQHIDAARKYAEELGDPRRLGDLYRVLGNHLSNLKDHAGSRAAHERSRQINATAGNDRGVADALQNIGFIDETEGNFEAARRRFVEAVSIYEGLGLKRHLANAYRQLGRVLVKQGHVTDALSHLEKSLTLAREFGGGVAIANVYRQLAIAHEAAGHLAEALDYQRKLEAANETIFGEKSRQQIALLDARFDAERRKHELDLLKKDQALQAAELVRMRWEAYGLIAVVVLGAVAVGALVSRQRMKLAAERRVLAETRAAKDAAERADALKTKLVGIASHDLKSPLRALLSATSELARQPGDIDRVRALARAMENDGHRMLTLVRDLLDMSAIEAGRLQLETTMLSPAALAREVCESLQSRAANKRQTLTCRVEPGAEATRVSADRARLWQALENLVDNALKFTPAGSRVTLCVAEECGTARIAVEDQGPGLCADDYARLFQPFATLSATPTGDESSTGLGLFIAHEIVGAHGGQMAVDSIPGQGTTFAMVLPIAV